MKKDNETKLIPLDALKPKLIDQLREKRFAEGTIHCIEIEIGHLQDYLSAEKLYGYSPEVGSVFLNKFQEDGEYSGKSFANYLALIRRLDDLYCGRDFTWRHSSKQSTEPEWCSTAIATYLENCKENGNVENSIIRKEIACRRFFIRLAENGCCCMEIGRASCRERV